MTQNIVQKLPEHSAVTEHTVLLHTELDDKVLIKTPFVETTRDGKRLYSVLIALTPKSLIIKSNEDCTYDLFARDQSENKVIYEIYHPLETTKVSVFKNSRRQSIKVCFCTNTTKYFELGQLKKRKIFWKLWCLHVAELNTYEKIWPFVHFRNDFQQTEEYLLKNKKLPWTDKHLYLGSKRAAEDNDRPKPVPGLGPTEDIKLLYLKPKYFGCWDQSEHWVQCGNSSNSFQYLN